MNSLGEGSALTNHCDISFFNSESRGAVYRDIPMSLFISVVFRNIVEIISSHNNSSLHFVWDDDALENLTSDRNVRGEGTFFINVSWFNSFLWGSDTQSNIFVESNTSTGFLGKKFFTVEENIFLLLEGSFVLRLKESVLDYQPLMWEYKYWLFKLIDYYSTFTL